jgi:hypothetical protein
MPHQLDRATRSLPAADILSEPARSWQKFNLSTAIMATIEKHLNLPTGSFHAYFAQLGIGPRPSGQPVLPTGDLLRTHAAQLIAEKKILIERTGIRIAAEPYEPPPSITFYNEQGEAAWRLRQAQAEQDTYIHVCPTWISFHTPAAVVDWMETDDSDWNLGLITVEPVIANTNCHSVVINFNRHNSHPHDLNNSNISLSWGDTDNLALKQQRLAAITAADLGVRAQYSVDGQLQWLVTTWQEHGRTVHASFIYDETAQQITRKPPSSGRPLGQRFATADAPIFTFDHDWLIVKRGTNIIRRVPLQADFSGIPVMVTQLLRQNFPRTISK